MSYYNEDMARCEDGEGPGDPEDQGGGLGVLLLHAGHREAQGEGPVYLYITRWAQTDHRQTHSNTRHHQLHPQLHRESVAGRAQLSRVSRRNY